MNFGEYETVVYVKLKVPIVSDVIRLIVQIWDEFLCGSPRLTCEVSGKGTNISRVTVRCSGASG